MEFIGRTVELKKLRILKQKSSASLVCLLGRRRIGKSRLIREFGKDFKCYFEIQGLGPDENPTNQDQLDHFASELSEGFNIKKPHFENWSNAFKSLADLIKNKDALVLLDEVSWMGRKDKLFASKLKSAWDKYFSNYDKNFIVLCGSVSTWIEDNILQNANFVGRVSMALNLQPLNLVEIEQFWVQKKAHFSSIEKMMLLSVIGGVPKYIEEISNTESVEQNIVRLCFSKDGFLFNEYDRIFKDVFGIQYKNLSAILQECLLASISVSELSKKLNKPINGRITDWVHILEISGFLSKDYYSKPNGDISNLNHLRIVDNYIRFYLKYILPLKLKIEKIGVVVDSLWKLKNFEAIMGYQFENLILMNRELIYPKLDMKNHQIISAAPYVQKKNTTNKAGCQIDLLIHTNLDVFYICEMKCKKLIDRSIIKETQKKIEALKLPKGSAKKPVLIYCGEIVNNDQEDIENYFLKMIHFDELCK
jgi:uncharacterized protein